MGLVVIKDNNNNSYRINLDHISLVEENVQDRPDIVNIWISGRVIHLNKDYWSKFYMDYFVPEVC